MGAVMKLTKAQRALLQRAVDYNGAVDLIGQDRPLDLSKRAMSVAIRLHDMKLGLILPHRTYTDFTINSAGREALAASQRGGR